MVSNIDHLDATPEAFHLIDYKTGSLDEEVIEEAAEWHWPPLMTYAVGLHQSDQPSRRIDTFLHRDR